MEIKYKVKYGRRSKMAGFEEPQVSRLGMGEMFALILATLSIKYLYTDFCLKFGLQDVCSTNFWKLPQRGKVPPVALPPYLSGISNEPLAFL